MQENDGVNLLTLYSDVRSVPVRWLWYPYIAYGKITLLQGDPGDGKGCSGYFIFKEARNDYDFPLHNPGALGAGYIRFLMNMEKGCLAVQACDKKTLDCFRVPAYDPKDWTFRIYSDVMQRMLWTRCGWEDDYTYRVSGVLPPEYRLVEFDLNAAERVAESQAAVDDGCDG